MAAQIRQTNYKTNSQWSVAKFSSNKSVCLGLFELVYRRINTDGTHTLQTGYGTTVTENR